MTYADMALYTVTALLSGVVVGAAWGGITAFIRALLD